MPEPMRLDDLWWWWNRDVSGDGDPGEIPGVLFRALPCDGKGYFGSVGQHYRTRAAALRAYNAARERVMDSDGRYRRGR